MRTLELPAPPTAVALFALPHAHGHARVQRAERAERGRQPAGTAPGNGWRWRPEPLPSRRCATGGAQEPLADQVRALRHVDAWCEAWQRMLLDPYDEHPATCLSAAASAPAVPG